MSSDFLSSNLSSWYLDRRLVGIVGILAVLLVGCGKNHPPLAKVIGTVKFRGETASSGKVLFLPEGGGKQGIGSIQADGTFELTTFVRGDGALVGQHHPVVLKVVTQSDAEVGSFERAENQRFSVEPNILNELFIELSSGEWNPLPK